MARTHKRTSQHRAARVDGESWGTAGLFVGQSQPWWVAMDLGESSHLQLGGHKVPWRSRTQAGRRSPGVVAGQFPQSRFAPFSLVELIRT